MMYRIVQLLDEQDEIPQRSGPADAYRDHLARVPAGTSQVKVTLQYHRETPAWDLLMLVFDPHGHRGTFSLNATSAGPRGDVELTASVGGADRAPGDWMIQIWAAQTNGPLPYRLTVEAVASVPPTASQVVERPAVPSLERILRDGPAWYRGELHTHTVASDGYVTPLELLDQARKAGLDFLAITDHNSIEAWSALAGAQDICIIPSLEVTLPEGHCNLFGLRRWLDWRVGYRGRTISDVVRESAAQGAVVSVNHPFGQGCSWLFDVPIAPFGCLEVLNYPTWWPPAPQYNPKALGLWTSMLNAGHRIAAVGGSDVFHLAPGTKYEAAPYPEVLANPAMYVYAENLSARSIMKALRRGQAYLTRGPQLRFEAQAGSKRYKMGERVRGLDGAVAFDVELTDLPAGSRLRWIKDGRLLAEDAPRPVSARYRFTDAPDRTTRHWYRVDLLNKEGEIWLVSNPIYAGQPPAPPHETWGQAIARARRDGAVAE